MKRRKSGKKNEEEGVKKEYVRKESDWIKNSHLEKMERGRQRKEEEGRGKKMREEENRIMLLR